MSLRLACWIVFSLVSGFLIGAVVTSEPEYFPLEEQSVAYHWKRVREYNEYMSDRANYTRVPNTNMASATPPFDNIPHLAVLDGKGELEHLDIVLPTVSSDCSAVSKYWMKYVHEHSGVHQIVYGIGAANPGSIDISGQEPFRFHLWVQPDFIDEINDLIQELEEIAKKECATELDE